MRIFVKRAVIASDGEPNRLLKEIAEARANVIHLEGTFKNMAEAVGQAERERDWLKAQLSTGELVLKDINKLNEWVLEAERLTPQLRQMEQELEEARLSLQEKIEFFNLKWVSVEAHEPIR